MSDSTNDNVEQPQVPPASKIRHSPGAMPGRPREEPEALPVSKSIGSGLGVSKITAFGQDKRHEEEWNRTPNTTGAGAIHVRTFHSKLTDDALVYLDRTINEWLDAHPQYEVKFVTTTVGTLTSKLKEPHLICQVWV